MKRAISGTAGPGRPVEPDGARPMSTTLLAISGSLRRGSKNASVLEALAQIAQQGAGLAGPAADPATALAADPAAALAAVPVSGTSSPAAVRVAFDELLGQLPLFNPDLDDLDAGVAPAPVLAFRASLAAHHGVIICSPEYAHGVAGAMKNALDWVVGSGELSQKAVLVVNASPTSFHAHRALLETLRTMDARVYERTLPPPPLGGSSISAAQLLADPARHAFFSEALDELMRACAATRSGEPSS